WRARSPFQFKGLAEVENIPRFEFRIYLFDEGADGLEEPEIRRVAGRQAREAGIAGLNGRRSPAVKDGGVAPFLDFRMAVSEGETAGAVMIGGGAVDPLIDAGQADEGAVVDADGIFVDEHPEVRGARSRKVCFLVIGNDGGGVRVGSNVAEPGVHGHAAHVRIESVEGSDAALVGGAFVN